MSDRPPLDDEMVIYATRYALGRMSYSVGEVVDYLVAHWDKLALKTRYFIASDIEHAINQGRIGMEMDKRQWMRVLERSRQRRENES